MNYPIKARISSARKFLAKIPDKTPRSDSECQKTEEDVCAFLFFSSSVIEMIKRQINDEFEVFDKENVFYIHGIRKKLKDSGIQRKIKQIIANHFSTPYTNDTKTNTTKSKLWILQTLRNQAMPIWLAAIAIYYSLSRSRNIKLIPLTLCLGGVVTLAGPLGAYRVSERSQENRLAGLLDGTASW